MEQQDEKQQDEKSVFDYSSNIEQIAAFITTVPATLDFPLTKTLIEQSCVFDTSEIPHASSASNAFNTSSISDIFNVSNASSTSEISDAFDVSKNSFPCFLDSNPEPQKAEDEVLSRKGQLTFLNEVLQEVQSLGCYNLYALLHRIEFLAICEYNRQLTIADCPEFAKYHANHQDELRDLECRLNISFIVQNAIERSDKNNIKCENETVALSGKQYHILLQRFFLRQQEYILKFDLPKYILKVLGCSRIKRIV